MHVSLSRDFELSDCACFGGDTMERRSGMGDQQGCVVCQSETLWNLATPDKFASHCQNNYAKIARAGYKAFVAGKDRSENPHDKFDLGHDAWLAGYELSREENE